MNDDQPSRFGRRALLKGVAGAGLVCLPLRLSAQSDPAVQRPREGDVLVRVNDPSHTPLTPADIHERTTPVIVWAMDPATSIVRSGVRLNQIILMRFEPEKLQPRTRARSAEGVVAYTAICTHAGCEVVDWIAEEQALSCPCHASLFDPFDEGTVVDGPAPRSLPALPLTIANGRLVVAAPFTSTVGFDAA